MVGYLAVFEVFMAMLILVNRFIPTSFHTSFTSIEPASFRFLQHDFQLAQYNFPLNFNNLFAFDDMIKINGINLF